MNSDRDQGAGAAPGRPHRRRLGSTASAAASRHHWDADAEAYLTEHRRMLGDRDLLWGPEGLREEQAGLLGDLRGRTVLELGCGGAQGVRWATLQGARAVGVDLSTGMLRVGRRLDEEHRMRSNLVAGEAEQLPFRDSAFDAAFSAFGALPFVGDAQRALRELRRVVRPGGPIACSVMHPLRWIFPDDPSADSLVVRSSYFDRTAYVETDRRGEPTYVEHHRTLADWVDAWVGAGLVLDRLLEPEWVPGTPTWGAWSAERGALIPGTLILVGHRPMVTDG